MVPSSARPRPLLQKYDILSISAAHGPKNRVDTAYYAQKGGQERGDDSVIPSVIRASKEAGGKEACMNRKLKTIVLGGLVAGSLVISAVPAMARNRDFYERYRWDNRSQSVDEALQQARRQAIYDASHHASRRRLAADEARIRELERDSKDYPSENDSRGNWD